MDERTENIENLETLNNTDVQNDVVPCREVTVEFVDDEKKKKKFDKSSVAAGAAIGAGVATFTIFKIVPAIRHAIEVGKKRRAERKAAKQAEYEEVEAE